MSWIVPFVTSLAVSNIYPDFDIGLVNNLELNLGTGLPSYKHMPRVNFEIP